MIRLVTLNMQCRTWPLKRFEPRLVPALLKLKPDVLVLTEYVEGSASPLLQCELARAKDGLKAFASSMGGRRPHGRGYHNQVLIASRMPIEVLPLALNPPRASASPSLLAVTTFGMKLIGMRAPHFESMTECGEDGRVLRPSKETKLAALAEYWEWLCTALDADILIGDMNFCPGRENEWDQIGIRHAEQKWRLSEATRSLRVTGPSGHAAIDHVLTSPQWEIVRTDYYEDPFLAEGWTDHAALVAEIERAT